VFGDELGVEGDERVSGQPVDQVFHLRIGGDVFETVGLL
jgi:hypothetical protein